MTEFSRHVEFLSQDDLNDLKNNVIDVIIIEQGHLVNLEDFGVLEEQDLFQTKEVPIISEGSDVEEEHLLGSIDMLWHADGAYKENVHPFVALYCKYAEEGSSPTHINDMRKAYESLSDDMKAKLEDYECSYESKKYFNQTQYPYDFENPLHERAFKMLAKATHKIVQEDKKGKYLFYSPSYTVTEHDEELYKVFNPDNYITHHWKDGQMIIWNNKSTVHKRDKTKKGVKRHMFRYAFHFKD